MHGFDNLPIILIMLAAAVAVVALFRRLKFSPVLGYLAAGVLTGPAGLKVISDVEGTQALAEFGVVFLLFVIGLELSFSRLKAMRGQVFGLGSAQVLITGGLIGGMVMLIGYGLPAAIVIGGGLALSSTALALQLIAESGEKTSQVGRLSLSVLLLQDLAVVPLLVLVPLLADTAHHSIGSALLEAGVKAAIVLVSIWLVGRIILRPLFRAVAELDSPELFTALTLLVALGTAWLTNMAHLSLALGGFVAGLLIAETEFRHQVETDIMPYRNLLLGLFFMAVGMGLDFTVIAEEWALVLSLSAALMVFKAGLIVLLCRCFGFRLISALQAGLVLSQGGEFGFVLFGLSGQVSILPASLVQILTAVIAVSMVLTPLAVSLGKMLIRRAARRAMAPIQDYSPEIVDMNNHVIIFGFGRVGQTLGKLLTEENIDYVALETNPNIVAIGKEKKQPVYYGDGTRTEIIRHLGIERARCAVVSVNDDDKAERLIKAIRIVAPDIPLIARSHDLRQLLRLENAGANLAISEMFEASIQLGAALLRILGVADAEIGRITQVFRNRDYALARESVETRRAEPARPGVVAFRSSKVSLAQK